MKKGKKYKLISFNGTIKSSEECEPNENYWLLVGQRGTIINFSEELKFGIDKRVLFQFDLNVQMLGLECHNSHPNSLWILKTDLENNVNE